MNLSRPNRGYIPAIDGLRGVAVLVVMGFHSEISFMQGGYIGVDIFFVLSGFLITSLLIKEYNATDKINFKNFYMRRILRLIPALILLIVVGDAISFLFSDAGIHNIGASFIALFYFANWARALGLYDMSFLGHTWSLSIEEQFYIFWPLLFLFLMRLQIGINKLILVVTTFAGFFWFLRAYMIFTGLSPDRVYNGLDGRVDSLLFGCVVGLFLSSDQLMRNRFLLIANRYARYMTLVAIVFFGWVIMNVKYSNPQMYYWIMGSVVLFTCVIIIDICSSQPSFLRPVLESKPLVWIGQISYGLYLWNYPVYALMWHYHISVPMRVVVGTLLIFCIATFSHYVVERPILKLKTRFQSPESLKREDIAQPMLNT